MLCNILALCDFPADPTNGNVATTGDGDSVGDVATYTCNRGFELIGDDMATCTQIDANNAEYSPPIAPTCSREYGI